MFSVDLNILFEPIIVSLLDHISALQGNNEINGRLIFGTSSFRAQFSDRGLSETYDRKI